MSIKAIFLDLGGVLVLNKTREIGERYKTEFGLTPEKSKEIFQFIQSGDKTDKELQEILNRLNVDLEIWNRYCKDLFSSEYRNDDLYNLIRSLKNNKIIIVFTTNNSANLNSLINKYKIDGLADLIINSSKFEVTKPDSKFWDVSLSETRKILPDIKPSEILVIDDSERNYESAKDYGFNAVLYSEDENSLNEIKKYFNL